MPVEHMLRYNKSYQRLADEFAIVHGEGLWSGARYLGHHHQRLITPGCEARNWLVFEPIWGDDEPRKLGVTQYILIEEEEICLFSSIYDLMGNAFEAELNATYIVRQML